MNIKIQSVSVNTLFAAALASFLQIVIAILSLLSPFFLTPFIELLFGEQLKYAYMQSMVDAFQRLPILIFGIACMVFPLILYIFAYKKINKGKNIKLWSILALIASFLVMHFGSYTSSLIVVLGMVGSICGLIYKDELKK